MPHIPTPISIKINNSPVVSFDKLREQFEEHYSKCIYNDELMEDLWQAWLACAIQNGVVKQ